MFFWFFMVFMFMRSMFMRRAVEELIDLCPHFSEVLPESV